MKKADERLGWTIASIVLLVVDVFGLIPVAVLTLGAGTSFRKVYESIGTALPLLLSVPAALYAVILLTLTIVLVLKEVFLQSKPLAFALNALTLIGEIAFAIIFYAAMLYPMFQVMKQPK